LSPSDGGLLCETCGRRRKEILPLGATAVEVLRNLQAARNMTSSGVSLPASVVREIRSAVPQFIQYHMDREIKSASFLYQFFSL
jgi:recombinational DNA repair protein (RecF pathway)